MMAAPDEDPNPSNNKPVSSTADDAAAAAPPHDDAAANRAPPDATKGGLRELLRIAIPTALANLAEYLPVSVALYFIGRRGDADDLDAVGLGRSYFNISCFSTSYGLISALRTLCPQAAGARKGKELHGLYAQRALVIVALAAVIGIIGIHFADAVLIHVLGQPRQLARRAKRYGLALLPALFGIPCMTIVQRVMTAEGHVFANLAICAAVFATAPAWQNFLVYRHGLGFVGAAWASSITNNQYLLLQIPYCLYVGLGHVFRPRSIREVFDRRGIREFLGLSLPGLVASLLEWWSMEFVIALAGTRRSPAVLAAVVCALNVQTVLEMCWLGGTRRRVDGVSVGMVSLTARGPAQARWSLRAWRWAPRSAREIPRVPDEQRGSAFWPHSAPLQSPLGL